MQQEHNHLGDACYAAYAQGCRHADCLVAFQEYKLRLAQRKINGEYRDLRLRENQLRAEQEQFKVQHPPAAPEPAEEEPEPVVPDPAPEPAVEAPRAIEAAPAEGEAVPAQEPPEVTAEGSGNRPDAAASEAATDAQPEAIQHPSSAGLLAAIQKYARSLPSGSVPEALLRALLGSLDMTPETYAAALAELEQAGEIRREGPAIRLGRAVPHPKPAPAARRRPARSTGSNFWARKGVGI